jgi:hypothetical protein
MVACIDTKQPSRVGYMNTRILHQYHSFDEEVYSGNYGFSIRSHLHNSQLAVFLGISCHYDLNYSPYLCCVQLLLPVWRIQPIDLLLDVG